MPHPIPADAPGTDHRPQPGSGLKRVTGSRWLPVGVLVLAAVIGLVLAAAVGPRSTLGDLRGGDPILVADVEAVIGDTGGLGALSVARLRDGKVTYAGLGEVDGSAPTPQTPYELGSITKTFTGMLLADAVTRKEVELDDPVASYLTELASTPAGGATLRELSTHTSGLPTLPPDLALQRLPRFLLNDDPDAPATTEQVLASAATTPISNRGTYSYSNLGMALLGHVLARAAGEPSWNVLVQQRLLDPLKMNHTIFMDGGTGEPAGLAQPHRQSGWPAHTWSGPGFDPAGVGTRTTAEDMMQFAQAIIAGKAPGMAALKTTTKATDRFKIGLAWHSVSPQDGDPVVWHNGGTGGTRTMLALDLKAKTAVLVLNSSARDVDDIAVDVLIADRPGVTITPSAPTPPLVGLIMLAVALLLVGSLIARCLGSRDRVHVITGVAEGAVGLVLALIWGPWSWLPGWTFGVLAGIAVGGVVLGAARLPRLPTWPHRRRVLAVLGLLITLALGLLVIETG